MPPLTRFLRFSRLKARSIVLSLLTVLLLAFLFSRRPKSEPSFQGTSVTDWTHLVSIANLEDPGVEALLAIGPLAVPYIFRLYEGFGTPFQRSEFYFNLHGHLPKVLRKSLPRPTRAREESSKAALLFALGQIHPSPPTVEPFLASQLQSELPR